MNCFICNQHISKFSSLLVYYKIVHLLKPSSTYECTQNQCTQLFPNLNSFKKHTIKKHYIIIPNKTNTNYNNNDINTSLEVQSCITQHLNTDDDSTSCENESIQNNNSIGTRIGILKKIIVIIMFLLIQLLLHFKILLLNLQCH